MNPLLIASIRAAVDLGIDLAPYIEQMVTKGQITPDQQAAALAEYESLKTRGAGQFEGPEWKV